MHPRFSPFALLALPTLITAISLADFGDPVPGLSVPCSIIYKQTIVGCSASDFQPAATAVCSTGCVKALQALKPKIDEECGNHTNKRNDIIVAFLAGAGPQSVCPNANEILSSIAGASTPAASSTSSNIASSTTDTAARTTSDSSDSATVTSNQSQTATAQIASTMPAEQLTITTSSGSLVMDASSTPSAPLPTTSVAEFSQTGENDGSGGGSPFDSPGNMKSAAVVVTFASSLSLFTVLAMLLAILR